MTQTASLTNKFTGKRHDLACSVVLGLVLGGTSFGSLATVGVREYSFLKGDLAPLIIVAATVGIFAITAIGGYAILRNIDRFLAWADRKEPLQKLPLAFDKRSIVLATVVILVLWIPYIVLQYPTAMNGDTYNQLYQFQTSSPTFYTTKGITVEESFVDHHPVFDTLVFGAFLSFGDLVGSQNLGLFAYSLFQCILMATGLALTCCYLDKLGVPKVLRLVLLAFCALFPPIPCWACVMVKDSLNSAVYIYFCLLVAEAVRSRGKVFDSKAMIVWFIVLGCLCILTKKSGAIVVALSAIALLVYLRSRWVALGCGLVVPLVVCFALVPAVVYPAIGGVAPGGKQEAFGFAFQQVITAMNENDDLADGEREALGKVLNVKKAQEKYRADLADPVKNRARDNATTEDYLRFIPAYFSIGVRHPVAYTASVFSIAGTLLTPGRTFSFFDTPEQEDSWIKNFTDNDTKGELHLTFDKPEPVKSWMKTASEGWRAFVRMLGPFQVPFNTGFYSGWIPLICLIICLFHDKRYAIALAPMLAYLLIIVLGPASSVRYMISFAYVTPLMLGLLCASLRIRAAQPAAVEDVQENE